jgi:ADP-ribose pyrophosphatase
MSQGSDDPGTLRPSRGRLDPPPAVALETIADHGTETGGFLRLRRLSLRHRRPGAPEPSPVYRYDLVERDALDAVALVLVAPPSPEDPGAGPRVCLRSAVRPPLALRPPPASEVDTPGQELSAAQWEIPAGLIEPGETPDACALREAWEETGHRLRGEALERLGPPVHLAPGVLGEQVHFRLAWVDPARGERPPTDGHPLEAEAALRFVPLAHALEAIEAGLLGDVKTELALHRLARREPTAVPRAAAEAPASPPPSAP